MRLTHSSPCAKICGATTSRGFASRRLSGPAARAFWVRCLPALAAAVALRVALTAQVPFALIQPDSPDLLATAKGWFEQGDVTVKSKRTFLVPALYLGACGIPRVPALATVAVAQHLLGVLAVLLAGLLCRLWLRQWRWLLVPATLLVALNPAALWFEHVLMAEAVYGFCTLALAAAGSWFALRPGAGSFAALAAALVLQAGARPEGKLFFPFGIALAAAVWWRDRRALIGAVAALAGLGVVAGFLTRTSQAGLLLLTAVIHLVPDDVRCAPGLGERLAPVRDGIRAQMAVEPAFPGAGDRRTIGCAVEGYLAARPGPPPADRAKAANQLCLRVAVETLARQPAAIPGWLFVRFRHTAGKPAAEDLEAERLQRDQMGVWEEDFSDLAPLGRRLGGSPIDSAAAAARFVAERYPQTDIGWFNAWRKCWATAWAAGGIGGTFYGGKSRPGIPLYFLAALAGMIGLAARRSRLRAFHILWGGILLGLFVVILATANVKPRFRMVFEPFVPLYLAALGDHLMACWTRWVRRAGARENLVPAR